MSVKKLNLGDAPMHPKKYFRRLKHLSLGCPHASPSPSTIISSSFYTLYFITSCVLCYAWSVLHLIFSLFIFFLLFITSWTPAYIFWERNTLHSTLEHNIGFMLIFV